MILNQLVHLATGVAAICTSAAIFADECMPRTVRCAGSRCRIRVGRGWACFLVAPIALVIVGTIEALCRMAEQRVPSWMEGETKTNEDKRCTNIRDLKY